MQRATNLSRSTIHIGINELNEGLSEQQIERTRRKGGGRDAIEEKYPDLKQELQKLLDSRTLGDPMQAILWTSKCADHLSQELHAKGYSISEETVIKFLHKMGYSLQSNRKGYEGSEHPGRDGQFQYISEKVKTFSMVNRLFPMTPRKKN